MRARRFPEPAIEYASAAPTVMSTRNSASKHRAGGGCRCTPTVLPGVRQGGPERRCEPHEVEDRHAGDHRGDQDPRAIALVERDQCVGRRADLRLIAVDEVRDEEEDRRTGCRSCATSVPRTAGVAYTLVDEVVAVVDAVMISSILARDESSEGAPMACASRRLLQRCDIDGHLPQALAGCCKNRIGDGRNDGTTSRIRPYRRAARRSGRCEPRS